MSGGLEIQPFGNDPLLSDSWKLELTNAGGKFRGFSNDWLKEEAVDVLCKVLKQSTPIIVVFLNDHTDTHAHLRFLFFLLFSEASKWTFKKKKKQSNLWAEIKLVINIFLCYFVTFARFVSSFTVSVFNLNPALCVFGYLLLSFCLRAWLDLIWICEWLFVFVC